MKKTAIIISAILAGEMAVPSAATAKNNYPTFPTRPKDIPFNELPEEEQKAYNEGFDEYKAELCRAYWNGEYDWDFNLDGKVDVYDTHYIALRYLEMINSYDKIDYSLCVWTEERGKEHIHLPFTAEMRAKVDEEGDLNGDGRVNMIDLSHMLMTLYSKYENGDVNNDGMLDARDASKILTYYSEQSVNIASDYETEINMEYLGDLNGDEIIDASDASFALAEYSKRATE
ncbi:MAG: hypothetical protein IKW87_00420 [Ruminococcus sp.]|nr:hypothetical protein [Ruminococcus sp.]